MVSNWFYYCFTLLAATFIFSSCLNSDDDNMDFEYSADAQITSLKLSSNQDSMKVLSDVKFSIDQVSSAPIIFNKDSLPYLFDFTMASINIQTNAASGIKLFLTNPDSSYIWDMKDSVNIKKLKEIEVYAQDGKTKKTYIFDLRTHQQDPDTIHWRLVKDNFINNPTQQKTILNKDNFYTFYKKNNSVYLSTSSVDDGMNWTNQNINGLSDEVIITSIQNVVIDNTERWLAIDSNNKSYISEDGVEWIISSTTLPVKSILGKMPSYSKDSILLVVNDEGTYKFAKTIDFSSINILNEIPQGFPVMNMTFTSIKDSLNYTAKYLVVTGGSDINNNENRNVWVLQENEYEITSTSKNLKFNTIGSSLFKYDEKIYLMTSDENENVFYTSEDYGVFWEKASIKQSLPSDFAKRSNQSVCVDNENYIWIFGGETSSDEQLTEIWKGRINKFTK